MSANDPKRTFDLEDCCHAKLWSDPLPPVVNPCCNHITGVVLSLREGNATTRFHFIDWWSSGHMAASGARAAAGPNAADRRADGLCGERSDCAVLARNVPGCAYEAGMDGRQQSPDRSSLERQ